MNHKGYEGHYGKTNEIKALFSFNKLKPPSQHLHRTAFDAVQVRCRVAVPGGDSHVKPAPPPLGMRREGRRREQLSGYNRGRTLPGMQPRPPFDRTLLIPIAIGVVSILGIVWIFLTSDLRGTFNPPTAVATTMPFDVSPLQTEAASLFPSATPAQDETLLTATATGPVAYPGPPDARLASTSTLVTESRPTPTPFVTPTPDRIQPLAAGRRYDDTDPNIAYDRFWTALKNPSTVNEYKGTIHASNSVGGEASFRFKGEGFRLGYKRGKSFGTVTVLIDDQPYSFHEQAYDLVWRSPELSPGDHFVRIIHESGESINLDYIEILP